MSFCWYVYLIVEQLICLSNCWTVDMFI
jgi:hypothetical protein